MKYGIPGRKRWRLSPADERRLRMVKITPQTRWSSEDLAELWRFRDLLQTLAGRDVKLRYRQTALGIIWVLLQPVLSAGIFSFVFGRVAKLPSGGIPYFVFSYAGVLGWNAFQGTLTRAGGSLVGNAQLVSKVYFPRLILPLSSLISASLDFGIGLALMIPLLWAYGVVPGKSLLLLPLWAILIGALALGVSVTLAALTVSYRDVQYVLPVFVQLLLYGSPVAYSVAAVPAHFRTALWLNPLSSLMEGFRASLLGSPLPPGIWVIYSIAWTLAVCLFGVAIFRKLEGRFADVI